MHPPALKGRHTPASDFNPMLKNDVDRSPTLVSFIVKNVQARPPVRNRAHARNEHYYSLDNDGLIQKPAEFFDTFDKERWFLRQTKRSL
jgi:hypothetical protein